MASPVNNVTSFRRRVTTFRALLPYQRHSCASRHERAKVKNEWRCGPPVTRHTSMANWLSIVASFPRMANVRHNHNCIRRSAIARHVAWHVMSHTRQSATKWQQGGGAGERSAQQQPSPAHPEQARLHLHGVRCRGNLRQSHLVA